MQSRALNYTLKDLYLPFLFFKLNLTISNPEKQNDAEYQSHESSLISNHDDTVIYRLQYSDVKLSAQKYSYLITDRRTKKTTTTCKPISMEDALHLLF